MAHCSPAVGRGCGQGIRLVLLDELAGGSGSGGCYDVIDNSNDQVYWPESKSATAGEVAAVEATWYESVTRGGSITLTGYRPGNDVACGSDSDGAHLFQHSARNCAAAGMTADQILQTYYGPTSHY